MHARTIETSEPAATAPARPALVPVETIRDGEYFIRMDSPSEVLTRLSYAGADIHEYGRALVIVIAINHDSQGYVPGQLLRIRYGTHVRRVHEQRGPVFTLEQ